MNDASVMGPLLLDKESSPVYLCLSKQGVATLYYTMRGPQDREIDLTHLTKITISCLGLGNGGEYSSMENLG